MGESWSSTSWPAKETAKNNFVQLTYLPKGNENLILTL